MVTDNGVPVNDVTSEDVSSDTEKKRFSYGDESVDFWGVLDPMDEADAETSDLLRGYMETAGEILSKTRGVEIKEGEVRRIANSILRKYTGHYSTEHAQRIELILDVAAKNPVYPIEDVVGEVAAVMKGALSKGDFVVDAHAEERAEVFEDMRGFKKTYLTRDQLETLESRSLSENMITDRKILLQLICNRSRGYQFCFLTILYSSSRLK